MRKSLIALSLAVATAGVVHAQVAAEKIPADFLAQFAPFAIALLQQQFPNPPVKVDVSAEKALGYHVKEQVGVVVLPDKNLTGKAIEEAADKEIPAAVIATKSLSLEEKGELIGSDKLAVADFNGQIKIPVFFVSVKGKGEERTLEIYSKEGKPLVSVPLKKQAGDAEAPVDVKLTNIDLEKKKLDATISLGGAYETSLKLGVLPE